MQQRRRREERAGQHLEGEALRISRFFDDFV